MQEESIWQLCLQIIGVKVLFGGRGVRGVPKKQKATQIRFKWGNKHFIAAHLPRSCHGFIFAQMFCLFVFLFASGWSVVILSTASLHAAEGLLSKKRKKKTWPSYCVSFCRSVPGKRRRQEVG